MKKRNGRIKARKKYTKLIAITEKGKENTCQEIQEERKRTPEKKYLFSRSDKTEIMNKLPTE